MNKESGSNATEFGKNLVGQTWKSYREIKKQKDEIELQKKLNPKYDKKVDSNDQMMLYIMILGLISFVGVEPARVILRKNIGRGVVNHFSLYIACIMFFLLGLIYVGIALIILFGDSNRKNLWIDGKISYFFTGIVYFFLSIYTFFRLGKAEDKDVPHNYTGDSRIEISRVWEPVVVILLGIIYSLFINILGGLPIVICGVSVLIYSLMEKLFFGSHMQDTINQRNSELNQKESFNEIDV